MSEHRDEYKRDGLGQFSKGTKGGPGNPYGRSVAKLKIKMLEVIDEDKLEAYILRLYEMAMEGDHQAGKMLLLYLLGKPEPARDPDQVDVEEWNLLKQEALIVEEMPYLLNKPDPEFPLEMVRAARPVMAESMGQQLHDKFEEERELEHQEQVKKERRRQKQQAKKQARETAAAPSPIGGKRCEAPLPIGSIGKEVPSPIGSIGEESPLPIGSIGEEAPSPIGSIGEEAPSPIGGERSEAPSPIGANRCEAPSPIGEQRQVVASASGDRRRGAPSPIGEYSEAAPLPNGASRSTDVPIDGATAETTRRWWSFWRAQSDSR